VIVAALVVVLGLFMFVVVAWRQADNGCRCLLSRILSSVLERHFHRKPNQSHSVTQPTPAAEERSRLRGHACADVQPTNIGSLRLTVPTDADLCVVRSSTATSTDGGSSEPFVAEAGKQRNINDCQ